MVIAAVDEALAVVLVVQAASDSGDWSSTQLIPAFWRPGVVHDRVRIAQDRADEGNLASVPGPGRAGGSLSQRRQLAGVTRPCHVEHEDLANGATTPHKSHQPPLVLPSHVLLPP